MYLDMYHMKIEEITSKTKKQKENNSPWNFTPESKEHKHLQRNLLPYRSVKKKMGN